MRRNLVIAPLAALLITTMVAGPAVAIRPDGTGLRTIMPLSDFRPRGIDWGPPAPRAP